MKYEVTEIREVRNGVSGYYLATVKINGLFSSGTRRCLRGDGLFSWWRDPDTGKPIWGGLAEALENKWQVLKIKGGFDK